MKFKCDRVMICEGRHYPPSKNIIETDNPALIEMMKRKGYKELENFQDKTISELKNILDKMKIKYNIRARKQELIDLIGGEV